MGQTPESIPFRTLYNRYPGLKTIDMLTTNCHEYTAASNELRAMSLLRRTGLAARSSRLAAFLFLSLFFFSFAPVDPPGLRGMPYFVCDARGNMAYLNTPPADYSKLDDGIVVRLKKRMEN